MEAGLELDFSSCFSSPCQIGGRREGETSLEHFWPALRLLRIFMGNVYEVVEFYMTPHFPSSCLPLLALAVEGGKREVHQFWVAWRSIRLLRSFVNVSWGVGDAWTLGEGS